MSDEPLRYVKCARCGWVHFRISLEEALINVVGVEAQALAIDRLHHCFQCGADASSMLTVKESEVPYGSTIQAIVVSE